MNLPDPAEARPSGGSTGGSSTGRRLHPSAPRPSFLDTSILQDIATGIASGLELEPGPDQVEPAGSVGRHLVLATDAYDAWVMVWGPHSSVPPHDHDGSIGVLHVVTGELVETDASYGFDPAAADGPQRVVAGQTSHTGPFGAHGLVNPTDALAVSVNVYSPPLGSSSLPD